MFFELHEENRIGYKELSHADLGRATKSKQTHIGLFDDVLTFLPNTSYIPDSMVIYNENAQMLSLLLKDSRKYFVESEKEGSAKALLNDGSAEVKKAKTFDKKYKTGFIVEYNEAEKYQQ